MIKKKFKKIREIALNEICNHKEKIFNLLILEQVSEKVMDQTSFIHDAIIEQRLICLTNSVTILYA
jgi:hypothetical protein